MSYEIIHVHQGIIADEEMKLSLLQLCDLCRMGPDLVVEMVEEGILEPEGEKRTTWRFSHKAVEQSKKVMRLRRDLNINLAGVALALDLLDRIERLENLLERGR